MTVARNLLEKFIPKPIQVPIIYNYQKFKKALEPEIFYLSNFIDSRKRVIDIGANEGLYTYALSKMGKIVESFEPQVQCAEKIRAYSHIFNKNINVYQVGLSNEKSLLNLYTPIIDNIVAHPLGSLSKPQDDTQYKIEKIQIHKLDNYNFNDVSFIKIDVEGHESEVIEGAKQTILREKPVLLVEIEQRHIKVDIQNVFKQILSLGYEGSFLLNEEFLPIDNFSYEIHQKSYLTNTTVNKYINNFIFKPQK